MSESVSQDLCLVDRILDKRIDVDTGEVEYLIRWLGADRDGNDFEDSWEPDYNVFGEELIEEFERMRAARRLQYRANKAGRLSVHSSPRVDGDDYATQRLHPAPPRYHAQVPSSTSGINKSRTHDHQQVPSLPAAGQPLHYPALSRPPRSLAPLPSYPATSQSLYSKPTPGHLPSSNIPTMDISKTQKSTLPTVTSESGEVDTTEPMNVDETDESLSHSDKRKRDGSFQLAKRSVMAHNGPIIRPLNLDFDLEKSYFKSMIVKSPLVKDATFRKEMLMILKNPEQPGLADNATLKRSETWLIEVKRQQQQDLDVSLFLALDIPKGIAKALFLPQSILERQRQDNPGSGLVLTDRTIVSSILMGDLEGSGLCPQATPVLEEKTIIPDDTTTTPRPSSPSETPLISTLSEYTTETKEEPEPYINGHSDDTNMESPASQSNGSVEGYSCGWEGCGRTLGTAEEIQSHVMDNHLKSLLNGVSLANAKDTKTSKAETVNGSHSTVDREATSEQAWEIRYEFAQDAYRSMKDEIGQLKGLVQKTDDLIESSKLLYTTAIGSSEETIRRLEASLEWEKKKWSKYVDEVKSKGAKVEGSQPQPSDAEQLPEGVVLDLPMEAQAMNAIRRIERLLTEAKKEQEQLEKENAALYAKKQGLGEELRKVTLHYEEAAVQLSELESKELSTLEELRTRKLNIQKYKEAMEREQEESRKTVKNLQETIDTLMKAPVNTTILQKEELLIPPADTVDGAVSAAAPDTTLEVLAETREDVDMTPATQEVPPTTTDTHPTMVPSTLVLESEPTHSTSADSTVPVSAPLQDFSPSAQAPLIERPTPATSIIVPESSVPVFAAKELAAPEISVPLATIPAESVPATAAAITTTAALLSQSTPTANGLSSPTITLTDSSMTPSTGFSTLPVSAPAPTPIPSYLQPSQKLRPPEPRVEWHALEDPEDDEDHSNPSTMNLVLPSTPDLLQLTNDDYGDIMDDESVERSSPSSASTSNLTIDSASAPLGGLHPSSGLEEGADPLAGLLGDPTDFIDLLTKSLNP